jgi:hypothetical protein
LGLGLGGVGGGSVARAHSFGGSHANNAAAASDATARAAIAALLALGRTFPAAAAANAAAILARITEPMPGGRDDNHDNDDGGGGGGGGSGGTPFGSAVCIRPGLEGVADAVLSALCTLAGVDAADEVLGLHPYLYTSKP